MVCAGDQTGIPDGRNPSSAVIEEAVDTQEIRKGDLPKSVVDLFQGLTKINTAQWDDDHEAIKKTGRALLNNLSELLNNQKNTSLLKVCLQVLGASLNPGAIPSEEKLNELCTAVGLVGWVFQKIEALFNDRLRENFLFVKTVEDFLTIQFLALFTHNCFCHLKFRIEQSLLADLKLFYKIEKKLRGASWILLDNFEKLEQKTQQAILKNTIETKEQNRQLYFRPGTVDELVRSINFLLTFGKMHKKEDLKTLPRILFGLSIDFSKSSVLRVGELIITNDLKGSFGINSCVENLTKTKNIFVSDELSLSLSNFEKVPLGRIEAIIKGAVQSFQGTMLSLPTLKENPTSTLVMKSLCKELLCKESNVIGLDFKGSQLSKAGWEQLALLAESKKPFYRISLTRMQIPTDIALRLGALRAQVIDIGECGLPAEVLQKMVAGWFDSEVVLKSVELRGNRINEDILKLLAGGGVKYFPQKYKKPASYKVMKRQVPGRK